MKALRSSVGTVRAAQPRVRSAAPRPSVQRRAAPSRRQLQVQAIFSFLGPKAPAGGNAKAAELADELIELVSTKRASAADVNKLVSQLAPLGTKNPVRSKLLFGAYKLVYSSKPGAALGTRQILEEPDLVREVSEVKVLGLLPGTQTQSGELNGVSGDTYEEVYDKVEVKGPVGGERKAVDVARLVQVVYLDQELRVVRVKQEGEAGEGSLLVYQRLTDDSEEEEDEAPAPKQQAGGIFAAFAPPTPKEGTATIAEREVMRKLAAAKDAKGAAPRLPANLPASPATVKTAARGGTVKVAPPAPRSPSPPPRAPPAPRVDPKAAAEAQRREAEAKAKAKEAALAKEKAEAEKRAAAERQSAIKALLEQLSDQLKEAQADSRDAAKEAKDLERANGAVLKQVAGARLQIRSAADEVEKVEAQLSQAAVARTTAEQALKQALAGVSEAQAKVKAARK